MRSLLLVSLFAIAPLVAQDQNGKEAAKGAPAKAAPMRFGGVKALDVDASTQTAISALLALPEGDDQDQWPYEGVYREDRGQLPVGYRVGGTSIVCWSLISAPHYDEDSARQDAVRRGVAFVLKTLDVERMSNDFIGTYDVRGWGHIYALNLFLELRDRKVVPAEFTDAVAAKTTWLVKTLCESAIPDGGGWNYSRPAGYRSPRNRASTFMTAPALQVLFHAKARGYEVADTVLDQALDALERARSQPGGYAYGAPATSQNDVPAEKLTMMDKVGSSAARATAVESTLLLAGRGDVERLRRAILRFFAHWDDLAVRKSQTGTHIPPYGIAPYYFLYGHVYAAQAIELLPDGAEKDELRVKLLEFLARSREEDGSWNDRQFARSAGYGTAMAILVMQMPKLPLPIARSASK